MRICPHCSLCLTCCSRATALYNAVKKQFGLHSYLLPLALPRKPLPPPVPVPALLPRLPPPPTSESAANGVPPTPTVPTNHSMINTICMAETDIQQTARFTREFVVMSLVPWMEKCVLEWNENVRSGHGFYFSMAQWLSVFVNPEVAITSVFFYAQTVWHPITLAIPSACTIFWTSSFVVDSCSQRGAWRACPTSTNPSLGRVRNCLGGHQVSNNSLGNTSEGIKRRLGIFINL